MNLTNEAAQAGDTSRVDDPGDGLFWTSDVPMVTDRFHIWDYLKVSVISVAIAALLLAVAGWLLEGEPVVLPWRILGILAGGLFAAFLVVSLFMGNKYRVTFGLSKQGVIYQSGRRERRLSRITMLAGGIAGNATAAGAGALASSREALVVPWKDVRSVHVHQGPHVIVVKNSWRTLLRLYCPPQLFAQASASAIALHRRYGPPGEVVSAGGRRSWPQRAAWFVAGGLLTWGTQIWDWNDYDILIRLGVVGGGLVALGALLPDLTRRIAGFLGGALVLAYAGGLIASALDPVRGLFGTSPAAVLDTGWLVVAAACTVALVSMGVWSLISRRIFSKRAR